MTEPKYSPMRIKLAPERREMLVKSLQERFSEQFSEELSDFRAESIIDFFVRELGPPVYNQAIRDAHAFIQDKLADLEGEVYEPETPSDQI